MVKRPNIENDKKQMTIDNLPAQHPAYTKGREFLDLQNRSERIKEDMESSRDELIELIRSAGREYITVTGYVLRIKEIEAKTTIVVK